MKTQDLALQKSFLQKVIIGDPNYKNYYALRKMFGDYLTKLNVAYFDTCCPEASLEFAYPLRYNSNEGYMERFDGTNWVQVDLNLPNPSASTASGSEYLLSESGDVFTFDGVTSKKINNTIHPIQYELPFNFLSQSIETNTMNGAFSTATVAAVGPYDKVTVTLGDSTSYVRLTSVFTENATEVWTLRVKVITLGTNSLVGLRKSNAAQTQDTNSANIQYHANLNTGIVFRNTTAQTTVGTLAPFVTNGDIVEFTWTRDYKNLKNIISMRNVTTGNILMTEVISTTLDSYVTTISNPSIVLADGEFTILNFTIQSTIPQKPKIMIAGDSMGSGFNILAGSNTLYYKLDESLPYNISSAAAPGSYIYSMNKAQLPLIDLLRPDVVVIFHYLVMLYGDFEVGDPENVAWKAAWDRFIAGIIKTGARPVLIKVTNWPVFGSGNEADWATFVDSEVTAHPEILVLDLRGQTLTYDSSGYHYDGTTYELIKNLLITLLETNNLL